MSFNFTFDVFCLTKHKIIVYSYIFQYFNLWIILLLSFLDKFFYSKLIKIILHCLFKILPIWFSHLATLRKHQNLVFVYDMLFWSLTFLLFRTANYPITINVSHLRMWNAISDICQVPMPVWTFSRLFILILCK